jgi:hypothetical protein
MARRLSSSTVFSAFILFIGSQAAVWAQDKKSDLLEETKRQLDLKAQKLDAEVTDSLVDAEKVAKTDPAKAAQSLRRTLIAVSSDLSMTADKRDSLLKTLRDRIQKYDSDADRKVFEKPVEPKSSPKVDDKRRDDDRVKSELDAIRALQKAGRTAEADRGMADLARRYPDNPAVKAWSMVGSRKDQLAEADRIKKDRGEAFGRIGNEIERVVPIPEGGVAFPPDWKDRVAKRSSQPAMTKKEKAILEALQTQISVEFNKQPISDVIEALSKKMNVTIMLDNAILDALGVAADTPVTVVGRDVSLRTILHKVLGEVGLTYIIEDETIKVVTPEMAKNKLVIRTYSVADLVWVGNTGIGGFLQPGLQQLQLAANIQNLIGMIVTTIEPDSWEINGTGGKGTIAFYAPTMSLIVKQSAELHMAMGGAFK